MKTTFVTSKDGTQIAATVFPGPTGKTRVAVVVDGAFCHRGFGPMPQLAPLLATSMTVIAYDRRGRGETGAGKSPCTVEREIEDIHALITHAKGLGGDVGDVCVYGTSSGAILAARAVAALPDGTVTKLALHEPPMSLDGTNRPNPPDFIERIQKFIAAGDPLSASRLFLKVVGVPAPAAFFMTLIPPVRKNLRECGPTLPHDFAVLGDTQRGGPLPDELASTFSRLKTPILTVVGSKSPPYMHHAIDVVGKSVAGPVEKVVLPGQDHNVAATAVGPELKRFFAAPS